MIVTFKVNSLSVANFSVLDSQGCQVHDGTRDEVQCVCSWFGQASTTFVCQECVTDVIQKAAYLDMLLLPLC